MITIFYSSTKVELIDRHQAYRYTQHMGHQHIEQNIDSSISVSHPPRSMKRIILPIIMGTAAIFGLAYSTFIAGQYISGEKIPISTDISPTPTPTTSDI